MVDRFPEAFARFEYDVNTRYFETYDELYYSFAHWSGKRWRNTWAQNVALAEEGRRLNLRNVRMPKQFGFTVEVEKRIKRVRKAKKRWVTTYEKRVKKVRRVVKKKYKGVGKVRITALSWYVTRGYSANKIQKRMKDRGIGIRRKTLLKIVREMRLQAKKVKAEKYVPKKYRKKKR